MIFTEGICVNEHAALRLWAQKRNGATRLFEKPKIRRRAFLLGFDWQACICAAIGLSSTGGLILVNAIEALRILDDDVQFLSQVLEGLVRRQVQPVKAAGRQRDASCDGNSVGRQVGGGVRSPGVCSGQLVRCPPLLNREELRPVRP